jgi:hypothetical protein
MEETGQKYESSGGCLKVKFGKDIEICFYTD